MNTYTDIQFRALNNDTRKSPNLKSHNCANLKSLSGIRHKKTVDLSLNEPYQFNMSGFKALLCNISSRHNKLC